MSIPTLVSVVEKPLFFCFGSLPNSSVVMKLKNLGNGVLNSLQAGCSGTGLGLLSRMMNT